MRETGRRVQGRILGLIIGLGALFLTSLGLGRYEVSLSQTVRILLDGLPGVELAQSWTDNMAAAVLQIRLPRVLLACLVGAALSAAGTAYQSVFRNPMAAPDILGASSGACFGAALAILLGLERSWVTVLAFGISLLTIGLVYLIGSRTRGSRVVNILLAGVMVSALFSAGTSYIKLVADPADQLPEITYWLMGSLSGTRMSDVRFVVWPMVLGSVPLLLLRWKLNLLTLREEEARTMGVDMEKLRLITLLSATVLTAAAVSVSGMIGWIGLVIPHLSRRLVGSDCRRQLPAGMVMGALFLLLVDDLSRNLLAVEIPIGILTAFVGAPFFLGIMMRGEAER